MSSAVVFNTNRAFVHLLVNLAQRGGRGVQRATLNVRVGSSLAGRSNRNWGPLPDDGCARGRRQRCTLCTDSDSGPLATHPRFFLVCRFPSPLPPACRPAGKNPCIRRISLRPLFSPLRTDPPTTVEEFRCIAAVERPTKNVVPNAAHIRHTNALGTQQG